MEDGVTEVQSWNPLLNLNSEDGSKSEAIKEKEEGLVSTEKVEKVKEEDVDREHTGKDCVAKDEAEENGGGGGGGIINNFISTLITPLSPKTEKATEHESGNGVFKSEEGADGADGERKGVENGGEGGLISNLISNFFHRSENEDVVETEKDKEEEEIVADEKIKRLKTGNEANDGGGGIIHNIVSQLPASIQVPTADEATILINSLVRD